MVILATTYHGVGKSTQGDFPGTILFADDYNNNFFLATLNTPTLKFWFEIKLIDSGLRKSNYTVYAQINQSTVKKCEIVNRDSSGNALVAIYFFNNKKVLIDTSENIASKLYSKLLKF